MATSVAEAPPPRPRSWRPLFLGLLAFLFVPIVPGFSLFAPIPQTALLLVPIIAACALAGWLGGGKAWFAIAWLVLAIWFLIAPVEPAGSSYDRMARGWALILAGSFGLMSAWNTSSPFIARAIAALGLAAGTTFILAIVSPGGVTRFQRAASTETARRGRELSAMYRAETATTQFKAMEKRFGVKAYPDSVDAQLTQMAGEATRIVPALLALESLGALALGWALYARLSRDPIGPRLSPLTEFRFSDQLIWGVAVGLTLLLPAFQDARGVGENLLIFFGILYLLRGLGVMTAFSRRRGLLLFVFLASVLLAPFVIWIFPFAVMFLSAAIALGFSDTWLDWRRRVRAA